MHSKPQQNTQLSITGTVVGEPFHTTANEHPIQAFRVRTGDETIVVIEPESFFRQPDEQITVTGYELTASYNDPQGTAVTDKILCSYLLKEVPDQQTADAIAEDLATVSNDWPFENEPTN